SYLRLTLSSTTAGTPRPLPPFPPRRSSDLSDIRSQGQSFLEPLDYTSVHPGSVRATRSITKRLAGQTAIPELAPDALPRALRARSEEHTSELQSLTNLVCRLLLAKKNPMLH